MYVKCFIVNFINDIEFFKKTFIDGNYFHYAIFSHRDYGYFWIPILGPHIGAIIGCVLYILFVGLHWPPEYEVTSDIRMSNKGQNKSREFKGKTIHSVGQGWINTIRATKHNVQAQQIDLRNAHKKPGCRIQKQHNDCS